VSRYTYNLMVEVTLDADDEETADEAFDDVVGQMAFRNGVLRHTFGIDVQCSVKAWELVEVES